MTLFFALLSFSIVGVRCTGNFSLSWLVLLTLGLEIVPSLFLYLFSLPRTGKFSDYISSESPPYLGESMSFISAILRSIWLPAIVFLVKIFELLALFWAAYIRAACESTELFRNSFEFLRYLFLGSLSVSENKFLLIRIVLNIDY